MSRKFSSWSFQLIDSNIIMSWSNNSKSSNLVLYVESNKSLTLVCLWFTLVYFSRLTWAQQLSLQRKVLTLTIIKEKEVKRMDTPWEIRSVIVNNYELNRPHIQLLQIWEPYGCFVISFHDVLIVTLHSNCTHLLIWFCSYLSTRSVMTSSHAGLTTCKEERLGPQERSLLK